MTKSIVLIFALAVLVGCANDQIVIESGESTTADSMIQEKENTEFEELENVEKEEGDVVATEEKDETVKKVGNERGLEIKKGLVQWGFAESSRTQKDIDTVIVHSVYNPFEGETHGLDEVLTIFEEYDVAPHYMIMRDGAIIQTVEEVNTAWHAGRSRVPDGRTKVNDFSIGIEMINSLEDTYTEQQYASLRNLVEDIIDRYDIKYVLGHDEIKVEDPWNFDWESLNDLRHNPRVEEYP